jgi:hypothetical protein
MTSPEPNTDLAIAFLDILHKRLPPAYKKEDVWQRVAVLTAAASRGELPAEEVTVALKMVLSLEGISCRQ